jgi:hypothetical protein
MIYNIKKVRLLSVSVDGSIACDNIEFNKDEPATIADNPNRHKDGYILEYGKVENGEVFMPGCFGESLLVKATSAIGNHLLATETLKKLK